VSKKPWFSKNELFALVSRALVSWLQYMIYRLKLLKCVAQTRLIRARLVCWTEFIK